jgi:ribonuclease HI
MDGVARASVYSEDFGLTLSIHLGRYATVFQAEITAILVCTETLLSKEISGDRICICVDSQAALKALISPQIKSRVVLDCVTALQNLSEINTVELIWVPGHSNVLGNEEADRLAREGIDLECYSPEPVLPLPLCVVHSYRKAREIRLFQDWWTNEAGLLRQNRLFFEGPNPRLSSQLIRLNRTELRIVIGMFTGHCTLDYHMSHFDSRDPICKCCLEQEETSAHLLCVCPKHARLRGFTLGEYFPSHESIKTMTVSTLAKMWALS